MGADERIDAILAQVRASGGRATSARRGILQALIDHHDVHPTVEHLTATVQESLPEVAESTVYRFLDELERLGIVHHVRLGQGPAVYHFTEDTHHHHLVCNRCGRTTEIPEELLDVLRRRVLRDYAFEIQPEHLAIDGRCVDCAAGPAPAGPAHHQADGHGHPHD